MKIQTCVRDTQGQVSGDGSVCLGATTLTGKRVATVPVAMPDTAL